MANFNIEDIKPLPSAHWLCLFGAYLEGHWEEFDEMCKEFDVTTDYAKYICSLADKYLPRRKDFLVK